MNPATPAPATNDANATMEAFFTRERANEGVELPLSLPDGTPTAHLIRIRGVDSDIFKLADAESRRKVMALSGEKDTKKIAEAIDSARLDTISALVIDWTFDRPATLENIRQFLREAPQIADKIDELASSRRLFFRKSSPSSTPSPASSSS